MHGTVRVGIELRQLRRGRHTDSGESTGQCDREVARHWVVTQEFCQNVAGGGFVEFSAPTCRGASSGLGLILST